MTEAWSALSGLYDAALSGMAEPWVIIAALIVTTFVLEDVAIAAAAALVLHGVLGWPTAFAAVAFGIALGDLGLYALGAGMLRVRWLRHRVLEAPHLAPRIDAARRVLRDRLVGAVLLARVVPGLRLVTYTAAGLLRVPFLPFTLLVVLAVTIWTGSLLWLAVLAGDGLADWLGVPPALVLGVAAGIVTIAPLLLRRRKPLLPTTAPTTAREIAR
ncbi:MAG: hypothetical protein RLY86_186 [Pseudomonadota bacterium]|jgi:membrane protein DedA with SNARE-associated domain